MATSHGRSITRSECIGHMRGHHSGEGEHQKNCENAQQSHQAASRPIRSSERFSPMFQSHPVSE